MNYGEILAYWYLRLNGFLLIQDYVLHVDFSQEVGQLRQQQRVRIRDLRTQGLNDRQIREQLGIEWEPGSSADCDLLAIRLRHTHETINGEPLAYDDKFFRKRGYLLNTDTIGLIVEVKTGDGEAAASNVVFTHRGLQTALGRLGLFPWHQVDNLASELYPQRRLVRGNVKVGKLLVSPAKVESPRWANLTLRQAEEFIAERMQAHARNKQGDRLRFPEPLMQFLAWKLGVPQDVPENEGVVVEDQEPAP